MFNPIVPVIDRGQRLDVGEYLYAAFLAGRSKHTRDAYTRDLADFAAFVEAGSSCVAIGHVLSLAAGDANGVLLAYRSHMSGAGLTPATINRRLSAIRSAVKLARPLGMTDWTPEVDVAGFPTGIAASLSNRDTAPATPPGAQDATAALSRFHVIHTAST